MSYYAPTGIPFLHALAREFTVCDRWFSSVMGPTWPNRFYLTPATAAGIKTNLPMGLSPPPTIWQRMAERCWTGKNYYSSVLPWYSLAFPANSFSGQDAIIPETLDHFYRDAARGELPNLAIIDPDFEANDGHPPHDLALCEAFVASVYRALAESPQWSRSLLVIMFDEHGGFFDHVAPPQTEDPDPEFRQLGLPRAGDRRRAARCGAAPWCRRRSSTCRSPATLGDALRHRQPRARAWTPPTICRLASIRRRRSSRWRRRRRCPPSR